MLVDTMFYDKQCTEELKLKNNQSYKEYFVIDNQMYMLKDGLVWTVHLKIIDGQWHYSES